MFGVSPMASEHPSMAMWACRGDQVVPSFSKNVQRVTLGELSVEWSNYLGDVL